MVLDRHRLRNRCWVCFCLDFTVLEVLLGALGCLGATLGAPLGDLGGHRGRLWDAWGLLRESLESLQERLGTSLGHLEAPGVDLGGFLPPKPPKLMTVVGIHDAAS